MTQLQGYELNGHRISAQQFYALACDPARNVVVQACAGSGKTWMLVSRIVRALLAGAQPQDILAITFTKKAAAEMRQRLHEWLQDFAHATPEQLTQELRSRGVSAEQAAALVQPLAQLHVRLLELGRPVHIRTFHAWFAALLRNAPLSVLAQLDLPARYELLEDDAQALKALWPRYYRALAAQPQALADYQAAVAESGRHNTEKALIAALQKRVEFALADQAGVPERSVPSAGQVFAAYARFESPLQALDTSDARERWLAWARSLGQADGKTGPSAASKMLDALECADLRRRFDGLRKALFVNDADRLNKHLSKLPAAQAAEAELQPLCAALAQHVAWQHQQRMTRLARLALAEFAALKRERGWVDMGDLERAALTLLADPVSSAWMQQRLDMQVRHLLIDEFQDTNPLQWQALYTWLSGYAGAGGGAKEPVSVFIVGDPKQSIYRFRRAEPQVFRAAQEMVVQGLGGVLLSCDHTRRNAQQVLACVNAVMAEAQNAGEYSDFRAHTSASAQLGAVLALPRIERAPKTEQEDAQALRWRDSLTQPRQRPEDTLRSQECRQAARWVAAEVAAGRKPGDFMVLARRHEPLAVLQSELRALHLPAVRGDSSSLAEQPAVQDMLALLDALLTPTHDLALAQALKSPLFGVDDADLAQLAQLAQSARLAPAHHAAVQTQPAPAPSWWDLLQSGTGSGSALQHAAAALTRWQGWVQRLPPHDALSAIYHDGDVLARYAAATPAPLYQSTLTALRALLAAALQVDGGRFLTTYALVRTLRAGQVPAPALYSPDAVQLLTVHGAKGLQAPVVLLLDTDSEQRQADTMSVLVDWPGQSPLPQRFVFVQSEAQPAPSLQAQLKAEQAARALEECNALYVAMTRAQTQLVLSSTEPHRGQSRSWWQRVAPHAQTTQPPPVPEPDFAQAALPAGAAPGAVPGVHAPTLAVRHLLSLPTCLPGHAGQSPAQSATHSPASSAHGASESATDSASARLGQAVHRLLQWAQAGAVASDAQVRAAAHEFGLDSAQAAQAAAQAHAIRHGQGAWAWDAQVVDWQGNEVALHHDGQALRIDRLVRQRSSGQWWVLDYKSALLSPSAVTLGQWREQLQGYRAAVQAAWPGAQVVCALLTADGRMQVLE